MEKADVVESQGDSPNQRGCHKSGKVDLKEKVCTLLPVNEVNMATSVCRENTGF